MSQSIHQPIKWITIKAKLSNNRGTIINPRLSYKSIKNSNNMPKNKHKKIINRLVNKHRNMANMNKTQKSPIKFMKNTNKNKLSNSSYTREEIRQTINNSNKQISDSNK